MSVVFIDMIPFKLNLLKLVGFICIICLLSSSCKTDQKKSEPVAENGILDLTEWNFDKDGIVTLNGPWKFIWMHDSSDCSKTVCDVSGWSNIVVPATWKSIVNESYGYGWLRLKIILKSEKPLRVYLKNTFGSSVLYCNGKEIITNGIPANTNKTYYPARRAQSVLLPKADTLVFAWKIVNYDDVFGGPRHPVVIGKDASVLRSATIEDFQFILIFGIIFITFLYHTLLWSRRPKDLTSLYFGIFCLVILIRLFITDIILTPYFDLPNWYYFWRTIEILTLPTAVALFLLFIAELYPNESSPRLIKILMVIAVFLIANALLTLFASRQFFTGVHYIYEASILLAVAMCVSVLLKAILNNRTYSKLLLAGFLILVVSLCIDVYFYNSPHGRRFVFYTGLVLFIIVQSIILSFKFADAHNTAEHLTEHLKEEVDLKTTDIQLKSAELGKMNLELKKADEYKTRFFQNVTHEFKTPLTLITGPVHSIINGQYGKINDAVRKQLEMVKQNGYKTLNLVNQLLELARSDVKQLDLKLSKHNIADTLNTIMANFESLAQRNKINISFINENNSPVYSFIDVEKFERIFYNLLSNSLKFTEPGGSVTMMLDYSSDTIFNYKITVCDTGRGISKDHIPFIFNRFYRVYNTEIPGPQGTGIGLALVKEYTVLHGGTINVKSKPGSGTSFILDFPVVESKMDIEKHLNTYSSKHEFIDPVNPNTHLVGNEIEYYLKSADKENVKNIIRTDTENDAPVEKDKTIVIIEDNRDMRSYIYDILMNDYKVLEAGNGAEGFDAITENMPDLIISDVMMPGMDGMELCKKIKTDIRTEHIPVILLTARSLNEDSIEGYLTGADDYISKPFSRDLLLIRINNLIESRNKIKEHFKTRFLMEPEHTVVESNIERFISKAIKAVECHISDSNFNVDQFASELGISQVQLYRKLTSVVGQSPAEFIRVVRLKRAAKNLEESIEKDINISEIGFSLGFSNISHFSKLFKKHYGISPTDYAKKFQ